MTRPFLAALLLAAGPAAALPWDGTYLLSAEADCDSVEEDGGALRIAEGVFHGVDASCRMTEPVDVLDLDATLYVMQCEGEDSEWSERAMFMKAADGDGLFVIWRGYAFRYDRCPDPEAADEGEDAPDAEEAETEPEVEGPAAGEGDPDAPEEGGGE